MSYIMAIDGGGTKTHLAIIDTKGVVHYQKVGPGSNHQSADVSYFKSIIIMMVEEALKKLHLKQSSLQIVYLGLSGADLPSDFKLLEDACKEIFTEVTFHIDNDAWLVLRSGLKKPYGAVAIAGTGTNAAAINQDGKRAILRSLGFTLGIYGGGLDIAREALHYAFRADELTYMDTMLRLEIPKLLGVDAMADVVPFFYPKQTITRHKFGEITALVNSLANKGDQVCQDILEKIGTIIGDQTAGVIKQVEMTHNEVPVVIGGRVFDGESPILIDAMKKRLLSHVPKAHLIKPSFPPVIGAYFLALDMLHIEQSDYIEKHLIESWNKK
jgi:N-acetylglucosamine kinase-like BadF-type ATPase